MSDSSESFYSSLDFSLHFSHIFRFFVGFGQFLPRFHVLIHSEKIQCCIGGHYVNTCRWTDIPFHWIICIYVFLMSVLAAGLIFRSTGLLYSLERHSSIGRSRPEGEQSGQFIKKQVFKPGSTEQ